MLVGCKHRQIYDLQLPALPSLPVEGTTSGSFLSESSSIVVEPIVDIKKESELRLTVNTAETKKRGQRVASMKLRPTHYDTMDGGRNGGGDSGDNDNTTTRRSKLHPTVTQPHTNTGKIGIKCQCINFISRYLHIYMHRLTNMELEHIQSGRIEDERGSTKMLQ